MDTVSDRAPGEPQQHVLEILSAIGEDMEQLELLLKTEVNSQNAAYGSNISDSADSMDTMIMIHGAQMSDLEECTSIMDKLLQSVGGTKNLDTPS